MTKRAKRSPYTRERKAEALALARIAGAEVASERSHIPVQTIRRWMDAAGIQPGADLPQDRLEALRDLAEATVTRDLVEGRVHGVQAMTVAGIARRHIAKPSPQDDGGV
jgi:transposase-like protein